MQKSESIKELAAALCAAQNEFPPVPFNATNPFLHNQYADLGSVIETAKPVLAAHSLSVSQLVYNDNGAVGVITILMHSSGEYIESGMALPLGDEKGKSLAQVAGSIITYLRRYAYSAILGLYADEDTDGNSPNGKKPEPKPAAAKTETLDQAKARMAAELKAKFPAVYPDGPAIGAMMKSHTPPLNFTDPKQYEVIRNVLAEAAKSKES